MATVKDLISDLGKLESQYINTFRINGVDFIKFLISYGGIDLASFYYAYLSQDYNKVLPKDLENRLKIVKDAIIKEGEKYKRYGCGTEFMQLSRFMSVNDIEDTIKSANKTLLTRLMSLYDSMDEKSMTYLTVGPPSFTYSNDGYTDFNAASKLPEFNTSFASFISWCFAYEIMDILYDYGMTHDWMVIYLNIRDRFEKVGKNEGDELEVLSAIQLKDVISSIKIFPLFCMLGPNYKSAEASNLWPYNMSKDNFIEYTLRKLDKYNFTPETAQKMKLLSSDTYNNLSINQAIGMQILKETIIGYKEQCDNNKTERTKE